MRNRVLATALLACCALAGAAVGSQFVRASDHDDGTQGTKTKNHGLTDLYVFREKDQNPAASGDDLIFIMNANPRSEGGKDYYYATDARYEFHVSTAASNAAAATGADDLLMRFEFGEPDQAAKQQALRVTFQEKGKDAMSADMGADGKAIVTTPRGQNPITNAVKLGGKDLAIFAGLREDPFFFDVDQFLKVRSSAAARAGGDTQAQVTFRTPGVDFTAGLNVLSLVVRVPKSMLPGGGNTYDVWETISVRK